MKKILLAATILITTTTSQANEFSIVKPVAGYHFSDRDFNNKDWNENYLNSLGLSYRKNNGFGASITYVDKNSVNNNAWFIHAEYIPTVWKQGNHSVNLGLGLGVRNGYPKKSKGRSETDFIPSGALQAEYCYDKFCPTLQVVPYTSGVAVFGFRYKF